MAGATVGIAGATGPEPRSPWRLVSIGAERTQSGQSLSACPTWIRAALLNRTCSSSAFSTIAYAAADSHDRHHLLDVSVRVSSPFRPAVNRAS